MASLATINTGRKLQPGVVASACMQLTCVPYSKYIEFNKTYTEVTDRNYKLQNSTLNKLRSSLLLGKNVNYVLILNSVQHVTIH